MPTNPPTAHLSLPTSHIPLTISAPGTVMLAGEHAVLHGRHALVGAVDQRVSVTLAPRRDDTIAIHSNLGERSMPRTTIDASRPFHYLGAILEAYQSAFPGGFDLTITAEFPPDVGLGSSSAVTVAALAAIHSWVNRSFPDREALMHEAIVLIRQVQGMGSGADVAATVWGGILLYKAEPTVIARYDRLPPIALVYAGYKTPTPEVVRIVEEKRARSKDRYDALFDRIEACTLAASGTLKAQDWTALGRILNQGQTLMEELGVCDAALADIVAAMNTMPGIRGAKISGSGLGDCVLGIGKLDAVDWPYRPLPVSLSIHGVRLEERVP